MSRLNKTTVWRWQLRCHYSLQINCSKRHTSLIFDHQTQNQTTIHEASATTRPTTQRSHIYSQCHDYQLHLSSSNNTNHWSLYEHIIDKKLEMLSALKQQCACLEASYSSATSISMAMCLLSHVFTNEQYHHVILNITRNSQVVITCDTKYIS